MSTILEQLKSKGIDPAAPASYTNKQLETIRLVLVNAGLTQVDVKAADLPIADAADVLVAALQGYGDTLLEQREQGAAQPGTIQAVTGKMWAVLDALEAFSATDIDDDSYYWLKSKVEEAQKLHPHNAGVFAISEQDPTEASKSKHAGTPWLIFGIVVLLAIAIVYERE